MKLLLVLLLLSLKLMLFSGCSTTVYTQNMQDGYLVFPNRNAMVFPISYRIHLDDHIYFVGYNVRVSRTHIYYTKKPSGTGFEEREIDDIRFITYSQKLPGALAGGVMGLIAGNIIMNVHDGEFYRSTANITSNTALIFGGFGTAAGLVIGAPQKVAFNHFLLHDPNRFRGPARNLEWVVD